MSELIEPRTLKGFRDFLPAAMIPRERLIETARRVYRSFGYSPIDTPALEYLEILAGKGGEESDRLMYQFEDHGGRRVGMRFDLTVPLARFVAQHASDLGLPFKRYHIGLVWRGENTHKGRYREFMQCDFDTIGPTSVMADVETVLVVHDLLSAIGFSRFTISVNNRMLLTGLLEKLGIGERSDALLRSLDKLGKIGPAAVSAEMVATAGVTESQAADVLRLASIEGGHEHVLREARALTAGSGRGEEGCERLASIAAAVVAAGVAPERLKLDLSIARGLDYYTGLVLETVLDDLPAIGSVCSGGRYDNLAELFTKQQLPGVGASLGLDRLLAAMEELGMIDAAPSAAPVFIAYFDENRAADYLRMAAALRAAGLGVEVYPEAKKLGQQLKYADRRNARVALIAGDREFAEGVCQVKDLRQKTQANVSLVHDYARLIDAVRTIVND
jgi:histidyl-tRNA synthetase